MWAGTSRCRPKKSPCTETRGVLLRAAEAMSSGNCFENVATCQPGSRTFELELPLAIPSSLSSAYTARYRARLKTARPQTPLKFPGCPSLQVLAMCAHKGRATRKKYRNWQRTRSRTRSSCHTPASPTNREPEIADHYFTNHHHKRKVPCVCFSPFFFPSPPFSLLAGP